MKTRCIARVSSFFVSPALRSFAIMAAALVAAPASFAQTWTGGNASGNWSNSLVGGNWNDAAAPTSNAATALTFSSNTNGQISNNDIANPFLLNKMTFSSGLPAFALSGSRIELGGTTPTLTQNSLNAVTIGTALTLDSALTLVKPVSTGTLTFSQPISGAYAINLTSAVNVGTIAFTANGSTNSYLGFTIPGASTINFQIGMDDPFGTGGLSGSTSSGQTASITVINQAHSVSGPLTLRANFSFGGDYNLTMHGQLYASTQLRTITGNVGTGASSGPVLLFDNATFYNTNSLNFGFNVWNGTGRSEISGVLANAPKGTDTFAKSGTGTWVLSGLNTFTHGVSVQDGTLEFNTVQVYGSTTANSLGKPLLANATIALGNATNTGTLKYIGTAGGGHSTDRPLNLVGLTGGGTLDASGTGPISFTGGVAVTGLASTGVAGSSDKTLTLTGTSTGANTLGGEIVNTSTAGYTLLKTAFALNAPSVTLASVDGIVVGAAISGTGIAPSTTVLTVDPATKIVGLSIIATGPGTVGQKMTVTGVTNNVLTAVAKTGAGTWALTGANTYAGGTTVTAGKLLVDNSSGSGTGTGTITVSGTGTLGGTGTLTGFLAVNSGGTVAPGASIGTLHNDLTGSKTATFNTGAKFAFDLGAPGTNDVLAFTGLTGAPVTFTDNLIDFTNAGGLAPGIYTLFTFDADSAYTGTPAIGLGLESYPDSEIILNANNIQLEVVASSAPKSTITIEKTNDGAEEGPNDGLFTITRDNPAAQLTVYYGIAGTATSGSDYTALSGSVIMAAEATTATISVPVLHDNDFTEGTETVVVTLTPDPTYTVGASNTATVDIADGTKPTVTIATTTEASEVGPSNGLFTVTRSAGENTAYPLTVNYTPEGTAAPGTDYTALSGSVTIPALQTTATIAVPVLQNNDFTQGSRTVILTLSENAAYVVGGTAATVNIADGIKPDVTIVKTNDGAEAGPANGLFTVTRTIVNGILNPLVVNYSVDGTATPASDYTALSGSVTIAANETTATILVPVLQDADFTEGTETVIVNLTVEPYYALGDPNTATVDIADGTKPTVTIAKTTDGSEDGPVNGVFTVSRNTESASSGPVTVLYSTTGSATPGSDYTALTGSVVIPANVDSATITVPVLHDYVFDEGAETVVVTLTENAAYTVGAPNTATVDIADITAPVAGTPYGFAAVYPFTNTVAGLTNGSTTDPTPVPYEKAIQFGSFSMSKIAGVSTIGCTGIAGTFYANNWPTNALALNTQDFFEVTITPKAADGMVSTVTLNTITFDVARQNSGGNGPLRYAVRSSIDGFAVNLSTFTIDPANASLTTPDGTSILIGGADIGIGTWRTGAKLTLSSFPTLSSDAVTPTVTFRIYAWGSSTGGKDGGIDNVQVNGSWVVNPIGTNHAVNYNGNGNTGGTAPVDANSRYANDATVTVLGNTGALTKTDSTFAGWNTAADGSGTSYDADATFSITTNTTLYAKWAPTICTVNYDGNGNTGGTAPTDTNSPYASGATVTVLGNTGDLTKTDYAFAGWNTAANGSGTSYAADATFAITTNTTLYAQWTATTTYTVTYDGNGNTGGTAPTDTNSPYASGNTVTVLGNTGSLTNTGWVFAGWNTAANGSGTSYAADATFAITTNTTLYAQWTATTTYTVTYDGNGNTGGSAPTDGSSPYASGATVTVMSPGSLTNTGHTFAGWNTAADGSGTSYDADATFAITTNTTLYAQWTATTTYAVTYNGNGNTGGSAPVDGSSPYASAATVTVMSSGSLTNTGWVFTGWNTASNGSGTAYNPAATFSISTNTTLYAQWIVTYASWAEAHGIAGLPSADSDHDGVSNGVEYFMGSASGFTTTPGLNGSNTVTWTNGGNIPPSAYGTQFVVQTSSDLKTWTNVLAGALLSNTAGPGGSLSYTLTGAGARFVRLVVTPN